MPNENKTEIMCVLDASGSMNRIKKDAIEGFNSFLSEQQEEDADDCSLGVITFNTDVTELYPLTDVQALEPLTEALYQCQRSTALYDAVGGAIDSMGARYAAMEEADRPGRVMVVIITDGAENASKEYTQKQVSEMIEHQQDKYNWKFVFLAANMDAHAAAQDLNINFSANYEADGLGARALYSANSSAVRAWRKGGGYNISDEDVKQETDRLADANNAPSQASDKADASTP